MRSYASTRKFRSLAIVFGTAILLSGCETLESIRVTDDEALARTGSITVRPETMQMGRHSQGGLELNYERYRGKGEQAIALGSYVKINETTYVGPQTVDNTADSESGRIAYNHLMKFGPHFELEPSLGITYERMVITTQSRLSNSKAEMIDDKALGLGLTLAPRFVVNRFIAVEAKAGLMIDEDSDTAFTRHIGLVLSPIPNIALRGGYYWRDQELESVEGYSDFKTDFEGVLASVTLSF